MDPQEMNIYNVNSKGRDMKRTMLLILCMFAGAFAWLGDNSTGWGDTSMVAGFRADSLKYSRVFGLSRHYDLTAEILIADSSTAGFHADSLSFYWGIQTGHPILNASNALDTSWNEERYICDTLSRYDSLYSPIYIVIGTDGTYNNARGYIDTSSITGFAKQVHTPHVDWDVLYRGFIKGLAGSEIGSFLNVRFNFTRREKL